MKSFGQYILVLFIHLVLLHGFSGGAHANLTYYTAPRCLHEPGHQAGYYKVGVYVLGASNYTFEGGVFTITSLPLPDFWGVCTAEQHTVVYWNDGDQPHSYTSACENAPAVAWTCLGCGMLVNNQGLNVCEYGIVSQDFPADCFGNSGTGTGVHWYCAGSEEYDDVMHAEYGPSSSPPDSCASEEGDPVDPYNGMFIYHDTDIGYPYPSMTKVTRSYSSGDTSIGPFGRGTKTNYDYQLPGVTGLAFVFITPESGRYTFPRQADGSYTNNKYPFLKHAQAFVNPDGTKDLVFDGGSSYSFNTDGLLVEEKDNNGNFVTISRDVNGNITGIADSFGRSLTITTTTRTVGGITYTLIDSLSDTLGNTVSYTYDAEAKLTSVDLPDGGTTSYDYDANDRISSVTNPRGTVEVTNTYDANGRVESQTHIDGGIFNFSYTESGGVVTETAVTEPDGGTKTYKFNDKGYVKEIVDAYGHSTLYATASGTNELLSVTDPLLRTTSYTYDANGNVESVTDPANNATNYVYDPTINKPTQITDALGNVSTMAYDAQGNVTDIWLPGQGVPIHMTYNSKGLLASVTDPTGNATTFDYYSTGLIANAVDSLGNLTHYEYDVVGRLTSVTDPRQKITSYLYNTPAREVGITDPLGGTTMIKYDSDGNIVWLTDARGNTVNYTYDDRGRAEGMTDQVLATESYMHDVGDNLTSVTDRKNQVTNYSEYDDLDRLTRIDYQDGSYTTFAYDPVGRIVNTVDSLSGMIEYTYTDTSLGEFPDKVKQVASPEGIVSYTYDDLGRRQSMAVDGELAVMYDYLPNGLVNTISAANPVTGAPMVFSFSYDDAGRRTGIIYPNGTTASYTYDGAGKLLTITHKDSTDQVLESLSYSYDASGNRTIMERMGVDSLLPGLSNSPDYDPANRLNTFNGDPLSYDINGNMTGWGDMGFTWDVRDRLVGITNTLTGDASFSYDGFGRRIEKTVGGVTTKYLYDGLDIVKEMDGLGNAKAWYVRALNIDEPLARIAADGTVRYYHADALGSIIALTDANGALRTKYNYSPFGVTQVIGEASYNPFLYTSRENDGTGLYYYRTRYYSPQMGRFISEDPIGSSGGINYYTYVGNNPLIFRDPTGLLRGELVYFSRVPGSDHPYHVGFDTGNDQILMLTGGEIAIVDLNTYMASHGYGLVGYADISDYISADNFIRNVISNKKSLQDNFRNWDYSGTMCIDAMNSGFGSSYARLQNDIGGNYRANPGAYPTNIDNPFFWRRNTTFKAFFENTGRFRR